VVDKDGNIATEIEIEKSTVVPKTTGVYDFNKSKVKTSINVKSGQTIILSGLVQQEKSKGVSKIPGLGDLPIIGELFKSRSFDNKDSELIVFVTPEEMDSEDQKNVNNIEIMKTKYDRAEDNMQFKLLD